MEHLDSTTMPLNGRILIEASAGTGKTYTISSLYLRLLLGRDPSLSRPLLTSEILVLTFTIAATDELRTRIRRRVGLARDMFNGVHKANESDDFIEGLIATSSDPGADRRLLTVALQTMDEAAIFTIHGFCARVLSEQSFDAGMLFDQSLEGDRDLLLQIASEDCFRSEIMTLPPALQVRALQTYKSPEAMADTVKKFLFRHNLHYTPTEIPGVDAHRLIELDQRIKQAWLEDNVTGLLAQTDLKGNVRTKTHLGSVSDHCQSERLEPDFWLPWSTEAIAKATKKGAETLEHPVFNDIDELLALDASFDINLHHQVVRYIKNHLAEAKVQTGELTLDDLLLEVHRAVKNPGLAGLLRAKWPIAMIDEFQDTDDLQYEIFSTVYPSHTQHPGTLLFIGDPKQAIYNFRGADVFTYINARETTDGSYSLATNWRSTPAMVAAVNHLFSRGRIFGENGEIQFEAVAPAPANRDLNIEIDGGTPVPVSLFLDDATYAGETREGLMEHAAEETARLLNLGQQGSALIDGKPIQPGQIAFLVRSGTDARAARHALAKRGVRSVYVTLESVFLTETADDLKRILYAVLEPTNETALKSALGTRLMQCSAQEILDLNRDWQKLQTVMEEFQQYHHLWATTAVAPMLSALVAKRGLAETWIQHPDGHRQMTNLRHLAELLQTRSMAAPGMRRLLKWFERERVAADTVAAEERQLRLESDSNLVQIVTMHASKGLEYDIVMIPSAGFDPITESFPLFHEALHEENTEVQFRTVLDFAKTDSSKAQRKIEDFEEIARLLYVALTRAKYRCYLGVSNNKLKPDRPIAKLLGVDSTEPGAISAKLKTLPKDLFETKDLLTTQTLFVDTGTSLELKPALTRPEIDNQWRMHSYTGLTRLLSSNDSPAANSSVQPKPGFGDDEPLTTREAAAQKPSRFSFPRGARVGVVLHSFMENLDFAAEENAVAHQARLSLAKMGLKDEEGVWQQVLTGWFKDIVHTPITGEVCLKDIPRRQRLDEMEFHFPIAADRSLIHALKTVNILPEHMDLKVDTLQGMMTGYIDLIVAIEGQYYLIDYKSNDLGPDQACYGEPALTDAMTHHHYNLQYLIYCVALQRYLSKRLPNYSYAEHFGGVRYLFLRGMSGTTGGGVYSARPGQDLIEKLDQLLAGTHE